MYFKRSFEHAYIAYKFFEMVFSEEKKKRANKIYLYDYEMHYEFFFFSPVRYSRVLLI